MRQVFALTALFVVIAGPAMAVQDRYGPPRAAPAPTRHTPAPALTGAALNWIGKSAVAEPTNTAPEAARPAPIAPWAKQLAGARTAAPLRPVDSQPAPVQSTQDPQPFAARPAGPAQTLPVQPQALVQAAPPRAAPAAARPIDREGFQDAPRFYSVSRQYGGRPDPIARPSTGRGEALTLADTPLTPGLGRSQAPLDDRRETQAVMIPDTKQNAAANRVSRLGF